MSLTAYTGIQNCPSRNFFLKDYLISSDLTSREGDIPIMHTVCISSVLTAYELRELMTKANDGS